MFEWEVLRWVEAVRCLLVGADLKGAGFVAGRMQQTG
jgi:hypothetical protein